VSADRGQFPAAVPSRDGDLYYAYLYETRSVTMEISELRTAQEIHREDMRHWPYRWRAWLSWPGNQAQVLLLTIKARARK
jgi:hypothetical protein